MPALVGLLGVTVVAMSRATLITWPYVLIGCMAFALATMTPCTAALLAGGGLTGCLSP